MEKICCPFGRLNFISRSVLDSSRYSLPFQLLKKLKYGALHTCTSCGANWYIDPQENLSDVVTDKQLKVLREWNKKALTLKPHFLPVLAGIGKTPAPTEGIVLKDHISIPCRCTTIAGTTIDFCTLNIQRRPPLYQKSYARLLFIDQVKKIEPSDYCLPLDIRVENTTRGYYEEVNEYDPTIIESPEGELYYIDYGTDFFNEKFKGSEMKRRQHFSKTILFQQNKIQETQVIADWTPELEKLFE